jgi:hypothetical protein
LESLLWWTSSSIYKRQERSASTCRRDSSPSPTRRSNKLPDEPSPLFFCFTLPLPRTWAYNILTVSSSAWGHGPPSSADRRRGRSTPKSCRICCVAAPRASAAKQQRPASVAWSCIEVIARTVRTACQQQTRKACSQSSGNVSSVRAEYVGNKRPQAAVALTLETVARRQFEARERVRVLSSTKIISESLTEMSRQRMFLDLCRPLYCRAAN